MNGYGLLGVSKAIRMHGWLWFYWLVCGCGAIVRIEGEGEMGSF